MNTTIPASGTGVTAESPIRVLFFVADGVEDAGGTVTNQSAGFQISGSRFIGRFSPSSRNTLKNDVRIGIIDTQDLPVCDNPFAVSYLKPYANQIGPMLKACAPDWLYLPVASGGDATKAMLKLFDTALAAVRLSDRAEFLARSSGAAPAHPVRCARVATDDPRSARWTTVDRSRAPAPTKRGILRTVRRPAGEIHRSGL